MFFEPIHLKRQLAYMLLVLVASLANAPSLQAQSSGDRSSYSLKEAVDYALQNNTNVKNALLDTKAAEYRVKETVSLGLPQIEAALGIQHSPNPQKTVLEFDPTNPLFAGLAGGGGPVPPAGTVIGIPFQLKNAGLATMTWNQLIFNGSYLIGLQASKTYQDLSIKSLKSSKIDVATAVTKAYYSVLVNQERLGLLDANINRLDSTLRQTKAYQKAGFVEQLDVDRLTVALNSLKTEKQNTQRLVSLSQLLLKFQMGMDINKPITLSDKLQQTNAQSLSLDGAPTVNYDNRIEFSLLKTQRELAVLDLKNTQVGYLPKLYASLTLGANTAASQFSSMPEVNDRWFRYNAIGFQLQVPIFDGLMKYHQSQQKRINLVKIENMADMLKKSIDLENASAEATFRNSIDRLKIQEDNLKLANSVVKAAKAKFEKGLGGNLDVVSAESALREAQINYYATLYDALIAKVDKQKAEGKMLID